ncbi:kinase-like domain-containing protein [Rhizophagus irregularis DAOM 181602=DAOM 197198]|nr:kinase-like domain-containing protein [Rhizophagus irregularis DAOM 181602=DAOM 197198]
MDIQYKWCKSCNFIGWKSGNDKIDSLIQLKINEPNDIRLEWIPYNQFSKIRNIDKSHFVTVYSATWEYEIALVCFNDSQKFLNKVKESDNNFEIYGISQNPDKGDFILVLQNEYCTEYGKTYCKNCGGKYGHIDHTWCKQCLCLNNSQNMIDEFFNEVRAYSISKIDDILNVYGISQNPNTKDYIIVVEYADGGSYNNWISINYKDFNWRNKIQTLLSIIEDMGLCEDVNSTSDIKTYGVIPYIAPEVLRRKPYSQAADIYSFEICNGIRPEINELEVPKCYIDLMKRCWDSNPDNRPNATELNIEIKSFYDFYSSYKKGNLNATEIRKQFKEAEAYRKLHLSSFKENKQHPGAIYTSRLLNPFTKDLPKYDNNNSECLSCAIIAD